MTGVNGETAPSSLGLLGEARATCHLTPHTSHGEGGAPRANVKGSRGPLLARSASGKGGRAAASRLHVVPWRKLGQVERSRLLKPLQRTHTCTYMHTHARTQAARLPDHTCTHTPLPPTHAHPRTQYTQARTHMYAAHTGTHASAAHAYMHAWGQMSGSWPHQAPVTPDRVADRPALSPAPPAPLMAQASPSLPGLPWAAVLRGLGRRGSCSLPGPGGRRRRFLSREMRSAPWRVEERMLREGR